MIQINFAASPSLFLLLLLLAVRRQARCLAWKAMCSAIKVAMKK
jgi:hypothetical protein